jgi:antitoxin MazE
MQMSQVVVGKWGKNLAVRLPRDVVRASGLADGERVQVEARDGDIIIRRTDAHAQADAAAAAEEIIAEAQNHRLNDKSILRMLRDGRRG